MKPIMMMMLARRLLRGRGALCDGRAERGGAARRSVAPEHRTRPRRQPSPTGQLNPPHASESAAMRVCGIDGTLENCSGL
eukprot:1613033-Rhodomonas_salina.2